MGAMPAPPPIKTISFSVSLAKNSPKGPEITTSSPGLKLKIYEDILPAGIPEEPGGGEAILTFNITMPFSSGQFAIE